MSSQPEQPRGELVQRRLVGPLDPLALLAALPDAGSDRALFEGKDGVTLAMSRAAVRAECRGEVVTLRAQNANGQSLLRAVRGLVGEWLTGAEETVLTLGIPISRSLDAEERLAAPAPLHALRCLLRAALPDSADPFATALIGVVAFDHAALAEDLPGCQGDPLGFPDFLFWVPDTLLLFDAGGRGRVLCSAFPDPDPGCAERNLHDAVNRLSDVVTACESSPAPVEPAGHNPDGRFACDLDDAQFAEVVGRMKHQIAAGEVYQVVPSRTFRAACPDPLRAYAALRTVEPSSYRFFVESEEFTLFGASPETSVRIASEGGSLEVEVRPIAGTRARGETADEDDRIEAEMRLDDKETAEHMMLVDLARNDVARVSVAGTRHVARLLTVERYARVMHLVSSVTGRLKPEFDALHALAACLNVGTLTGAPKVRATELLREAEATKRGPYGGAIGWINGAGSMDTAVVIRSAMVRDGVAFVRAGAGVVHDSDPLAEAEETRRKASALLSILGDEPQ
ncbi:anthranilate synthase component 1 [Sphingomonas sp. GCM10030256]|uniref:anthranilate synthase component 1 n=1 Tax=Sphingomonas sp. GCM10030256 TaxID=3273427 RepID=UPI00361DBB79